MSIFCWLFGHFHVIKKGMYQYEDRCTGKHMCAKMSWIECSRCRERITEASCTETVGVEQ